MSDEIKTIRLWDLDCQLAIILHLPTNIRYANQTGGYACDEASCEGAILPIYIADAWYKLHQHFFREPKYAGRCCQGIDLEDARYIDSILDNKIHGLKCQVDQEKLRYCKEAWIYLICLPTGAKYELLDGFSTEQQMTGVLTWPNSNWKMKAG